MKHQFVTHSGSERLILVFAGWAMDAAPFASLRRPGYDIAVVWDYASMSIDWSFCHPYREICIVAWSLGVYASAVTTYSIERKVTRRIAVCGTLYPVDRLRGIPEATFAGTLDGLDERSLHKFYRRVAGSRERFEHFAATMPARDIDGLKDELLAFYPFPLLPCEPVRRWDLAVIGRDDAIFPAVNQWRAWQGTPVELVDEPHLVDIQKVIDRYVVDKMRVGERFAKGRASYQDAASVQAAIVERLWRAACSLGVEARCRRAGAAVLEVGCGSGMLSRLLASTMKPGGSLELWDIAGEAPLSAAPGVNFCRCDAETAIMELHAGSLDIVASASTIQWFNSPSRFFAECARVLRPGGYALLSTFVRGNLHEVSAATGKSLALPDAAQWLSLVPDDFELLHSESYRHSLDFGSAIDVFRHLKATGVNSLDRSGADGSLKKALDRYPADLDGRYRATYRPLIMILRKK
ncbi:MAG: DUF452 family protein [Muribaculaceae bacterium]|nr:DUF452 family protein [Muribaculaceae bacterium]